MFDTAADYITQARRLLNDNQAPFRYPDTDLYAGLTIGLYEMDRVRPDVTLNLVLPASTDAGVNLTAIDKRYTKALLDFVVSYAESQDAEASDAAKSAAYQASFIAKLTGAGA